MHFGHADRNKPFRRYRIDTIHKLKQLAEFHNPKSFRETTRHNIVDYLDKSRRSEQEDPLHRWIETYELSRIVMLRYFRRLYSAQTFRLYFDLRIR
jgi:hypothetical protein